ncbi:MAG: hypothetical protein LBL66_02805 [Clostridiales bacterium]|jgi:hypothetical protein|nr:hypothetical protein [Clostridiales bacterium]
MMSNVYQILEMLNAGLRLSHTLLEDGKYDELPDCPNGSRYLKRMRRR